MGSRTVLQMLHENDITGYSQVFCRITDLRNFTKFTVKHLRWSFFHLFKESFRTNFVTECQRVSYVHKQIKD